MFYCAAIGDAIYILCTCYWLNRCVLGNIEATNATRNQIDTLIDIQTFPVTWDVDTINVGLAQACLNYRTLTDLQCMVTWVAERTLNTMYGTVSYLSTSTSCFSFFYSQSWSVSTANLTMHLPAQNTKMSLFSYLAVSNRSLYLLFHSSVQHIHDTKHSHKHDITQM